ncbi:Rne/Rng family ribonuclease [Georgenia alba]|uniref:Rne/Rng family ribonuclease n=1 Tax=Georgenia alba TaxID=2233858 RepID=A0ABW2QD28_9MICO
MDEQHTESTTQDGNEQAPEQATKPRRSRRRASSPASSPAPSAEPTTADQPETGEATTVGAQEGAAAAAVAEKAAEAAALSETTEQSTEPSTEPEEAPEPEQAEKPAVRRGRRSGASARAPEQRLDVLAELGLEEQAEDADEGAADASERADEAQETDPDDAGTGEPEDVGDAEETAADEATQEGSAEEGPRLPAASLLFQAPDLSAARPRRRRAQAPAGEPPAEEPADGADEESSDSPDEADEGQSSGRRRRRRGGRGRRNRGGQGDGGSDGSDKDPSDDQTDGDGAGDDGSEAPTGKDKSTKSTKGNKGGKPKDKDSKDNGPTDEDSADQDVQDDEGGSSSRRRRRRRRSRGGEGDSRRDEVTALKGSTRLEAKRQRRREGREAGRRRTTLSEAEFLARREAVDRKMVVREKDGLNQIAVLEDDVLVEHYVARHTQTSMVGNVYLGRVQNVLPSMEAAFVDLGKGRNAVLYAGEVNWDAAGMEGQPRRIEQALKSGDTVLVQVTKDPIGHKGARLTSQITLAGRHLVLVPSGAMTGISRKLPENERARLKKLLKEIVPDGAGVIVRTAAEGATEEQLRADVERLTKQWADIEAKSKNTKSAPALLKGEPELAVRVVRDVFNEDFESLTVAGDTAWKTISKYVKDLSPELADRMHHWTSEKDVFVEHRVDEQLAKGMDRKVWLPSGGSLVIDRTEAMTVIDVNTGKFTGSGGTLEETVTRNNLEAAEEIVRQLRLRDIGGIIVIDFIDMVLESNRDLVLRRLLECLGRDRTRHQVAEVTSLGLVQMTRKRVGQGLIEAFSTPCEHCSGRGFIVHDHPVERGNEGKDDGGGSRRRGRRGGGQQQSASTSSPSPAEAEEDPEAAAAREAVKATLATIAAAAASAHEQEEERAASSADHAEAGDESEQAETTQPETTQPETTEPETTQPETTQPETTEPEHRRTPDVAEPTAEGGETSPQTPDEPTGTGVVGAPHGGSVVVPSDAEQAAEDAASEDAPAPPAEPRRRPRRSRRAVSSGVVTPGESPVITVEEE